LDSGAQCNRAFQMCLSCGSQSLHLFADLALMAYSVIACCSPYGEKWTEASRAQHFEKVRQVLLLGFSSLVLC
jgi:hypothetical protein